MYFRNKKRNENCQVVEHLSRNSASLTSPNLVTKSTNHTTELSDTCQFQTAHLNKLKRKRKNNCKCLRSYTILYKLNLIIKSLNSIWLLGDNLLFEEVKK